MSVGFCAKISFKQSLTQSNSLWTVFAHSTLPISCVLLHGHKTPVYLRTYFLCESVYKCAPQTLLRLQQRADYSAVLTSFSVQLKTIKSKKESEARMTASVLKQDLFQVSFNRISTVSFINV